jgi:hypothetical protein
LVDIYSNEPAASIFRAGNEKTKLEVIGSSETFIPKYQKIRCHIPEDINIPV